MAFGPSSVFTSSSAVFDSSIASSEFNGVRTAYDLLHGTVEVLHCCGLGVGYTSVRDAFDVEGVPAGTLVTAVAELHVDGWIISNGCGGSGCWGYLQGAVASPQSSRTTLLTQQVGAETQVPVSGLVQLPVTIAAGQPQVLEFKLSAWRAAGGNHGARGIGTIRFTGLPVGVRVVSCNGYDSVAVPTVRTTWGKLKAAYR